VGASFIDTLGGALIFPFFSLYITQKFNVGMVEVGLLFTIFAVSGMIGGLIGGALTDRFGRRSMIIFGLIASAFTALAMGLIGDLRLFYTLAGAAGLMSSTGRPAQQAMVADLLGEEKRIEGFGIIRVAINLAITIGPAIGGLLAGVSYLLLFIIDAAGSVIAALIVYTTLPETRPGDLEGESEESILETFKGYWTAVQDKVFFAFIIMSILMGIVYRQMNSTLPVYLRDVHDIAPQGYGTLISLNAGMVVLFQFWVTRRISGRPPMLLMMTGTLFYGLGIAMFGFTSVYALFFLAVVIITIGEMIIAPTGQALVAQLSPLDMRGRYMAAYSFGHVVPTAVGPLLAGLVMDHIGPNFVWYAGGLLAIVAALGFASLHKPATARLNQGKEKAQPV
jgi:MFS family permease